MREQTRSGDDSTFVQHDGAILYEYRVRKVRTGR